MSRVPFGIQRLDGTVGGGAPAGSVVLSGLARGDPELFDLHYGSIAPEATLPDAIHYLSFTADETQLRREIGLVIDDEITSSGLDAVSFHDFSREYFGPSPVPGEWYADRVSDIEELGTGHAEGVLMALADRLDAHAAKSLVVIDSLTDLVASSTERTWADIVLLIRGLAKAATTWEGLVLIHVNRDALSDTQYGLLTDAVSGTMEFSWESGGSSRARTMIVKHFRGVLPRIESEDIVRFETNIGPTGFDISDVRKIR